MTSRRNPERSAGRKRVLRKVCLEPAPSRAAGPPDCPRPRGAGRVAPQEPQRPGAGLAAGVTALAYKASGPTGGHQAVPNLLRATENNVRTLRTLFAAPRKRCTRPW